MGVEGLAARATPDSCRDPVPGRDWFGTLAEWSILGSDAVSELQDRRFAILPDAVPSGETEQLAAAYDAAVASATGDDVSIGSTSTRVTDFVNRRAEFDRLYVLPPLLEACCRVIARPFKLSTLHARTLPPGAPGQALHVDVGRHSSEWPLVGFILMVDDFRPDNGATRRSLQGAFIPRAGHAATDFAARMQPETRKRLGPLARYVLALWRLDIASRQQGLGSSLDLRRWVAPELFLRYVPTLWVQDEGLQCSGVEEQPLGGASSSTRASCDGAQPAPAGGAARAPR